MDSKLAIKRSENELKLARIIFTLSEKPKVQQEIFDINDPDTYYSATISHAYYSIFYAARAYLLTKGIKTVPPEEHRQAYESFKTFVENGELDVELLKIYQQAIIRADLLLGIFKQEKQKRGIFTYRTLPQANKTPAQESIDHATTFYKHISNILN
ncbi:MAG: HEPN domain-containing protein [Candidatus Woesearchaeota archaeon]